MAGSQAKASISRAPCLARLGCLCLSTFQITFRLHIPSPQAHTGTCLSPTRNVGQVNHSQGSGVFKSRRGQEKRRPSVLLGLISSLALSLLRRPMPSLIILSPYWAPHTSSQLLRAPRAESEWRDSPSPHIPNL